MIKAIIIDDETRCCRTLELLLKEYCPDVTVLDQCYDAESGIISINNLQPDLVFLDIEMPGMNGFKMLEQFPKIPFAVVFITGFDQYAIKAFRFYAIDYLLKPLEPKELIVAVDRVRNQKQLAATDQLMMMVNHMNHGKDVLPKIALPASDGFEIVPIDEVLYCEAQHNYTYFHLKNKKKVIACRMLKEVEEQIELFPFFVRVHHSFIVNINEVKKYVRGEGGYVIMSDNSTVNVSRSRKDILLKCFRNP